MLEAVAAWAREALGPEEFSRVVDRWTLGKQVIGVAKDKKNERCVYATNVGECLVSGSEPWPERATLVALPCPPDFPTPLWSQKARPNEGEGWDTVGGGSRKKREAWPRSRR